MRETVSANAPTFVRNALMEAGGNTELALLILGDECDKFWRLKGTGIDREGGPRNPNWPVRYSSPPILTTEGK